MSHQDESPPDILLPNDVRSERGFSQHEIAITPSKTTVGFLAGVKSITLTKSPNGDRSVHIEIFSPPHPFWVLLMQIRWLQVAGFSFVFLAFISLTLFLTGAVPFVKNNIVFDVWVALCVAGGCSFLGGEAKAQGRLPLPAQLGRTSPVAFSVIGGIAVFVIVLLLMYALNR